MCYTRRHLNSLHNERREHVSYSVCVKLINTSPSFIDNKKYLATRITKARNQFALHCSFAKFLESFCPGKNASYQVHKDHSPWRLTRVAALCKHLIPVLFVGCDASVPPALTPVNFSVHKDSVKGLSGSPRHQHHHKASKSLSVASDRQRHTLHREHTSPQVGENRSLL